MGSQDWRYWITYEGRVEAPNEEAAIAAALEDSYNGKLPTVEVEQEGDEGA